MPATLNDFATGAKSIVAPEVALTSLANDKAIVRQREQENEIRQFEVDQTRKLSDVVNASENAPESPKGIEQFASPKEDYFGDYKQVVEANKSVQTGQEELKKIQSQMDAARGTSFFDQYKKTYDVKKAQVDESKKVQQQLAEKHINGMLATGLSVDPQTGEGYDVARSLFIEHDLAAARASGVTDPTQLARRRKDMESRLPASWSDTNAKYALSTVMKELQDSSKILETQRLEDARRLNAERLANEQERIKNAEKKADRAAGKADGMENLKLADMYDGQIRRAENQQSKLRRDILSAQQKLQLEPEGTGRQRLEDLIQESETQISTLQDEIDETVPKMKLARDVAAASSPELKARLEAQEKATVKEKARKKELRTRINRIDFSGYSVGPNAAAGITDVKDLVLSAADLSGEDIGSNVTALIAELRSEGLIK